jgi:uncharacterized coiled-coil protein SlyX
MTDYETIRKDIYESFHDTFHKLYISELKDQIADKDEIITANDHVIAEQQAEIEQLREALQGLVGAIADPTSQRSIPDALKEARAVLAQKTTDVC